MMHTLRYENSVTENAQRALEDAPREEKNSLKHCETEHFNQITVFILDKSISNTKIRHLLEK